MGNHNNWLRVALTTLLLLGMTLAFLWRDQLSAESLTRWFVELGWLAPAVFITCYAIATVFFLPGLLFTLAGGALFGPVFGTLYSLIGATIGAVLSFLTARYLLHDWVHRRTARRLQQLVEGVEREGWRFVAFVRLVPLIPFNLLNYALGLTRLRLPDYTIATFIFMAPACAAYTYLGYAGRELAAGGEGMVRKVLIALGLIATIAFVSRIIMRRHENRQAKGEGP